MSTRKADQNRVKGFEVAEVTALVSSSDRELISRSDDVAPSILVVIHVPPWSVVEFPVPCLAFFRFLVLHFFGGVLHFFGGLCFTAASSSTTTALGLA